MTIEQLLQQWKPYKESTGTESLHHYILPEAPAEKELKVLEKQVGKYDLQMRKRKVDGRFMIDGYDLRFQLAK